MPTDPYVPSELADRPRQQQNLPPGLALPAARDWRANRPGDLRAPVAAGVPEAGALQGSPGPNVGYAYSLAERARPAFELGAAEHPHDVVPVVAEIAGKRAALLGRAPVLRDVDLAVALLGYDGSADDEFVALRTLLVLDAAHDYKRRRVLVDAVPETLLLAPADELPRLVPEARAELRNALARAETAH